MDRRRSLPVESSSKRGVSELNSRLAEIFAHHRSKQERLNTIQNEKEQLTKVFEKQFAEKDKAHGERVKLLHQQLKSYENRLDAVQKKCEVAEKNLSEFRCKLSISEDKVVKLEDKLSRAVKTQTMLSADLATERTRSAKLQSLANSRAHSLSLAETSMTELQEEKTRLTQEISAAMQLQQHLGNLLEKRDEEVKKLREEGRVLSKNTKNMEEQLRSQFQQELDKHLRLRESQNELEKGEVLHSMKEEHKKNIVQYKEALVARNHDIENLKESNLRLKEISQKLETENVKLSRQNNRLEKDIISKNNKILEKEQLLRDMRSKYMEKTVALEETESTCQELVSEIKVFRQLLTAEEEHIRKKRKLSPPTAPVKRVLSLQSFDLNAKCLTIQCHEASACLLGWNLVNGDRSQRFDLPNTILKKHEKRRVLIGKKAKPGQPSDILWLHDVWDGYGSDAIQLVDPEGSVQDMIKLHNDMLPAENNCGLM